MAVTLRTLHGSLAGFGTFSVAAVAQHGGVDGNVLRDTGECLCQRNTNTNQSVITLSYSRLGATSGATASAKELVENIAKASGAAESAATTKATLTRAGFRIATSVDNTTLIGIKQHFLSDL